MDRGNQNVFSMISPDLILTRKIFPFGIELRHFPSTDDIDSVLLGMKDEMRNWFEKVLWYVLFLFFHSIANLQ
jgi:hypothetical protein